ncbi:MAG TPA: aldehyde dehydrogenase family protein [Solirubrobacterales bacterium]|nr:aldehyde dehydrogenase family protein [Solirubrobacterales bacterium]
MAIESVNPATNETLRSFEAYAPAQVDSLISTAHAAFAEWSRRPLEQRTELVRGAGELLRSNRDELAELATLEMGKVFKEAAFEVEKAAGFCDYYADRAARFLAPRQIEGGQAENWVRYEPLGAILAVMPWNFPYVQVFRFAPAMLVAGNVVLLKHASNVPQCALRIERLFAEAGLPAGAFTTLLIGSGEVARVLADERVRAVTLTGSEQAGSQVAAVAGRELKHSVMELGGSDPFIVLADADVADAARKGARARTSNTGQACINAKRFIVLEEVAEEFEAALIDEVARLRVGDPMSPETDIGPLAHQGAVEDLRRQVASSVAAGAAVAVGSCEVDRPGAYVEPMVITGVTPEMSVFREETFGPVAAVTRVPDERTAIALANDSAYGLGASIWTADLERAQELAGELEAGMVFVNEIVVSDARLPFGGSKRSGYGRELGEWGIHEFTQIKSIAVSAPGEGADAATLVAE